MLKFPYNLLKLEYLPKFLKITNYAQAFNLCTYIFTFNEIIRKYFKKLNYLTYNIFKNECKYKKKMNT